MKLDALNGPIGVWGLGSVGKSAVEFFRSQGLPVEVMNDKRLNNEQRLFLAHHNVSYCLQSDALAFLTRNNHILVSPGIDVRTYKKFSYKWLTELDLFGAVYQKPIIALTGSVGKTTITTLLSHILTLSGLRVATGGNIGTPMLQLLQQQSDIALLEVSSFQLEHCKNFAPNIAIVTNIYPNHLDRHNSFNQYTCIKFNIGKYQNRNQQILLPISLKHQIPYKLRSQIYFFDYNNPVGIMRHNYEEKTFNLKKFPHHTHKINWTIICCVLDLLKIPLQMVEKALPTMKLPAHRLEKVATLNGIDFYNDSKATTPEATLAAVDQLKNKPIILLLGGLSKGIDRKSLIKKLHNTVKYIVCFGKEANTLHLFCRTYQIPSHACPDLISAYKNATIHAQPGDQIVLSPAGSSFDLFNNYQERGMYFTRLIKELTQ